MDINNIGISQNIGLPGGARRVEAVKVETSAPVQTQQVPVVDSNVAAASEEARFQKVQAAANAIQNQFIVSDTTFTIYKDASGQYVTRFKSLRDGTVRTFPEVDSYRFYGYPHRPAGLDTEA